ncbi:DNA helicase/exodeoxyribonuclease V alpha subunit [Tahibacter aquaticus]|uniref:RecBCD enzyme subunit RecD n=1 Tax=Tahibacter aquaticus TaxID=520092 RepID=A0A4R6Z7F8_9GAMM|nr:exodeoxyribonuclease V subunit alpha [Tahibacter aquaticus]TDR47731.1 DNA helicase/exodeoxyribonuclease V alpha subunit [Tahibacter aquaticus]
MSSYRFRRDLDDSAAEVWRPLDRALAHWVRAHGGSAELAAVAAWASLADGLGDAALPLRGEDAGRHGMARLSDAALAALRQQPLVGDGSRRTPFVLDADDRFALWRNHADETAIAACLRQRRSAADPVDGAAVKAAVDALFGGDRTRRVQAQRMAVAGVAGRRLFVLTGGPGTGKTTTVLRMLLLLQRVQPQRLLIQVAAPTGKAAQRLLQSLRQGKMQLSQGEHALGEEWSAALAGIADAEAPTLHRLLGYDPRRNVFTRNRRRPLAADIVVVDEASMVDLALLRALLDALRPQARLILVGDADQLTSVAAGSTLMDLVAALEPQRAAELVRLQHSFRAERELVRVNEAVRSGDAAELDAALAAAPQRALLRPVGDAAVLAAALQQWALQLAGSGIAGDDADAGDAASAALAALRRLSQRQLLCALREDAFGALAANAAIEAQLRRHWQVAAEALWYPGRAVMITRNDYALRLFNGDIGLCLADADGSLRVWFETVDAAGQATARWLAPDRLPLHEGAFAVTVHKSQGSEYAEAAVLLPPDPEQRILSRQLLYTGVSRAKQRLQIWALPSVLAAALARPIRRAGGLAAKLRDGPAPPDQFELF